MKKLFWFGVGVLLALFAALATAESNLKTVTVSEVQAYVDDEDTHAAIWVSGLTQGAFIGYINKLMDAGFDAQTAVKIAESNCGNITPEKVLFMANGNAKFRKLPAIVAIPNLMWALCTKGETGS